MITHKEFQLNLTIVCPHCMQINRIPKKESYAKVNCGSCKFSILNSKPMEANSTTFSIILANSDLPVVVDFWAPWCGPCRQMAPAFEEASKKLSLKAQFVKIDTQEHQQLGAIYGIRSIPTMVLFKHGKEIARTSGAMSASQIQSWVTSHSS